MVAPAAMLDGQVSAIRAALDEGGFIETAIMGYSAKFASRLYDPFFKHGTQSSVAFGDKKSHQMDYGNSDEAMREIAFDIQEGADIVMVKPGMFYMDIIYRARREFGVPVATYNVSGEYALIKSAAEMGRLDECAITLELFTAFKRAGADLIISYAAKSMARWLKGNTP
jgi:porphobilinogen synthase